MDIELTAEDLPPPWNPLRRCNRCKQMKPKLDKQRRCKDCVRIQGKTTKALKRDAEKRGIVKRWCQTCGSDKNLQFHHDHSVTPIVVCAVLCGGCNSAAGKFGDDGDHAVAMAIKASELTGDLGVNKHTEGVYHPPGHHLCHACNKVMSSAHRKPHNSTQKHARAEKIWIKRGRPNGRFDYDVKTKPPLKRKLKEMNRRPRRCVYCKQTSTNWTPKDATVVCRECSKNQDRSKVERNQDASRRRIQMKQCQMCGSTTRQLCLHHDHNVSPAVVLAVLCTNCNCALGHFEDDPVRLWDAMTRFRDLDGLGANGIKGNR